MTTLFFSYSHKDEALRNELEVHLSLLKRQNLITTWHDRRIVAGTDVHSAIDANLASADIVLLLVSASFLSSDYCYEREMQRALEHHALGKTKVIPVILHPCDWQHSPFGSLRATPTDGKAVSLFANQDEALTIVAKDVRMAIEEIIHVKPETIVLDKVTKPTSSDYVDDSPRSSNLRLKKTFTDYETDDFLDTTFGYIARFFENSLQELEKRHSGTQTRFKRVDAKALTASIYHDGKAQSECTIWLGGKRSFTNGIAYYAGITDSRNQLNESLTVDNDGYSLYLKPLFISNHRWNDSAKLSKEGAAEYLWNMLVERLQ